MMQSDSVCKTIVCVATSEATWRNLLRYCFNHQFKVNRKRFDLAVVCNGSSAGFSSYLQTINPDFFITRPNLGFDLAGFDTLLKNIPVASYNRFILLHDDHWFEDDNWFDTLSTLADNNPDIDIFGNLLDCSHDKLVEHFEIVSRILGYGRYLEPAQPVFTQGVAGLFTSRAINIWQKADGIPHIHNNLKNVAEICERLASFILYAEGLGFMQIPPGFQRYLRHGSHISYCLEAPHSVYHSSSGTTASGDSRVPSDEAVQHFASLAKTSCSTKAALVTDTFDTAAFLKAMPRHRMNHLCFYLISLTTTHREEDFTGIAVNLVVLNDITAPDDIAAFMANMDYIITDNPEIASKAAALDRMVLYLHVSPDKNGYIASALSRYEKVIILHAPADSENPDFYTAVSLALLGRLVSGSETGLTGDELRVDHEIRNRICSHSYKNATNANILALLDEETPLFQDIGIETTTICNMSCPYCPNSSIGRPAAFMPDNTFHAIIDSAAAYIPDYAGSISPHFYGEPLVDQRLESFVSYAKRRLPRASVQLFTNGVLLDLKRFLALVDAGVEKFIISQHTPEPLPDLIKTLKVINCDYPDHARIEYFDQYSSNMKMNRGARSSADNKKHRQFYRCNQYKALIFDVTGTAVLCCNDYRSSVTFGSIHHNSVQDIWHNPYYRRVRNLLYYSFFPLPICRNCGFME